MKTALTIGLAATVLAATLSLVAAGSYKREPAARTDVPAVRKPVEKFRAPEIVHASTSTYAGVARIIHVPQGDENIRASLNDDDEVDRPARAYRRPSTLPLPRRSEPRWPLHSEAPPVSSEPLRAVLSAPSPQVEGPTPIRPLPRYGSRIEPADKFTTPNPAAATQDISTPPENNEPTDLPRGD